MFELGVQQELNRLKWEVELREKEAKTYADALKGISHALDHHDFTCIARILERLGV